MFLPLVQLTSYPKFLNWWWKFKWNVRREIKEDHVSCSLPSDASSFLQQSEIVEESHKLCNTTWYFFIFFLIQNISETIFCGRFLFSPLRTSSFWDSVCRERGRKEILIENNSEWIIPKPSFCFHLKRETVWKCEYCKILRPSDNQGNARKVTEKWGTFLSFQMNGWMNAQQFFAWFCTLLPY